MSVEAMTSLFWVELDLVTFKLRSLALLPALLKKSSCPSSNEKI